MPRFIENAEAEVLYQIAWGLAHLHSLKIVHRDINPRNILIYIRSQKLANLPLIKLADFGISKALKIDREDYTNTSVTNPNGTRGWMAPEMYQLERFDSKVDIFPMGCIFAYTLSGGKHPFGEKDDERSFRIRNKGAMLMIEKDLNEPYLKKGVAFKLIESMLHMDPTKRPTVEKVLNDVFFVMFSVGIVS